MRSAPPFQISVMRFGVWHTLVVLLSGSACLSMALWWWAQPLPVPHSVVATAMLGALGSALVAATLLWRAPPTTLRWDRQRWWMARDAGFEQSGAMTVAIDLGDWLLLRFMVDGAPAGLFWRWRAPAWIALQRPGLEAPWHALRCTLYAASPAVAQADAGQPTEGRSA